MWDKKQIMNFYYLLKPMNVENYDGMPLINVFVWDVMNKLLLQIIATNYLLAYVQNIITIINSKAVID